MKRIGWGQKEKMKEEGMNMCLAPNHATLVIRA